MDENNQNKTAPVTTGAEDVKCMNCGGATRGFKCANCGEKSDTHDPNHSCGGDMCQPNCVTCDKAQSQCDCQPQTAASSQ